MNEDQELKEQETKEQEWNKQDLIQQQWNQQKLNQQKLNQQKLNQQEIKNQNFQMIQKKPGLLSGIYALFFTFCLYKNAAGVTMPFFVAGTLFYFYLCMKKSEVLRKKDGYFYEVSILLLGCSTWITGDSRIILFNYGAIFLLLVMFMLHQFFRDEKWDIPEFIGNMISAVFGTIGSLHRPFTDYNSYIKGKNKEKRQIVPYIFAGLLIALPLIIIILMLLSSADLVFARSLEFIWKNIVIPENFIGILLLTLFAYFASYCFISYLTTVRKDMQKGKRKTGEPVIAITFNALIALVYLIFSGIQILYLFVGNLKLPDNYTYAQYAREGFFQLVAVCILNLAIVLFCIFYYKENKILKILLTLISICTYIMIASSTLRMVLYIGQYHLTFLRVFVLWALVVIFMVMTGILIYIWKPEFGLLKYLTIVITVLYLLFSYSHPDYFIADYNYSKIPLEESEKISTWYLFELSSDAAPVILEYATRLESDAGYELTESEKADLKEYFQQIYDQNNHMDFRTFNLSGYFGQKASNQYLQEHIRKDIKFN